MFLIDGYNLLFARKGAPDTMSRAALEAARNRLLAELNRFFARRVKRHAQRHYRRERTALVVFDGTDPYRGSSRGHLHTGPGGVDYVFAGPGVSADSAIMEIIARRASKGDLIVVTSDSKLARDAMEAGAQTLDARKFLSQITRTQERGNQKDLPHDEEPPCKRLGISRGEAEWWEAFFRERGL